MASPMESPTVQQTVRLLDGRWVSAMDLTTPGSKVPRWEHSLDPPMVHQSDGEKETMSDNEKRDLRKARL